MNSPSSSPPPPPEIDLIDLILSIWRGKWWVILVTAIFSCISIGYALLATEKWVSKAAIIAPDITSIGAYLDRYKQYQIITSAQQTTPSTASSLLFSRFLYALNSYENQLAYFKQAFPKANNGEISSLLRSVNINKPDLKKGGDVTTIELTASDATAAQQQLNALIDYTNQVVHDKGLNSLNTEIKTTLKMLYLSKEKIKLFAEASQTVRLKNLRKALRIAKQAGIKHYSTANGTPFFIQNSMSGGVVIEDDKNGENNFLFMLGENYLQAQIEVLEKSPITYPEQYYQIERQIKLLEGLLNDDRHLSFDVFSYQSSPNIPLQRSAPKRAMVVMIGTVLGAIVGIFLALFMGALASRRNRLSGS